MEIQQNKPIPVSSADQPFLSLQMIACPTKTYRVSQETGDYVNAYPSNIIPSYLLCALPKIIASYF